MIPKPNKPQNEKTLYIPISLLPSLSKFFEKLLLKEIKIHNNRKGDARGADSNSSIWFKRRTLYSRANTYDEWWCNWRVSKKNKYTLSYFPGRLWKSIWHQALEFKLHRDLLKQFYQVFKSASADRYVRVIQDDEYSWLKQISTILQVYRKEVRTLLRTNPIYCVNERFTKTYNWASITSFADCYLINQKNYYRRIEKQGTTFS